jgi:hypothetical protein
MNETKRPKHAFLMKGWSWLDVTSLLLSDHFWHSSPSQISNSICMHSQLGFERADLNTNAPAMVVCIWKCWFAVVFLSIYNRLDGSHVVITTKSLSAEFRSRLSNWDGRAAGWLTISMREFACLICSRWWRCQILEASLRLKVLHITDLSKKRRASESGMCTCICIYTYPYPTLLEALSMQICRIEWGNRRVAWHATMGSK